MIKYILMLFVASVLLSGCAGEASQLLLEERKPETAEDAEPAAEDAGYVFVYEGIGIPAGEYTEGILERLGEERDFYVYPSCAFDGDAKMYVYDGFEISTYVEGGDANDRVYSVTLNDDSVTTAEGVYIGQTYGEMVAAYGDGYEEIPGCRMYERDGVVLAFDFDEDDSIIAVTYYVADIYE